MAISLAMKERVIRDLNDMEGDFPFTIGTTDSFHKCPEKLNRQEIIVICHIKKGSGRYTIDKKNCTFKKGDILIFNDNEVHFSNDEEVFAQVTHFKSRLLCSGAGYAFEIEYLKPFWSAKFFDCKLDATFNNNYETVVKILSELERVFKTKENNYKQIIKLLLLKLSLILTEYLDTKNTPDFIRKEKNSHSFQQLFKYIDQNCSRKMTLKELATLTNMSVSNFCTVFKNKMGISPMEYVIRTRLIKAAQQLVETDLKIVDIAENCGFVSMPHFIECFKKYKGIVPSDYRKLGK
jgi:AraC-like DNA-binding protein